jgi:large subunit ribosomal protein L24
MSKKLLSQLMVKGCNMRKVKDMNGNSYTIEKKIHYSNVNLWDPEHEQPTRVSLK